MTEQSPVQKNTSTEKHLMQDIRQFAKVWVNNFQNNKLDGYVLTDENFEMDCRSFGFTIEAGWDWIQQAENQKAAYDKTAMEKTIDGITDWKLLGSVIYARWKEHSITLEGVKQLASFEVRQWFVITLCRLARIAGEQELLRPYIVCHVQGKKGLNPEAREALDKYYQVQRGNWGDAFACDRPSLNSRITEAAEACQNDYIADYIAINPFLMPEYHTVSFRPCDAQITGQRKDPATEASDAIAVVCEDTPAELLETYRDQKVTYLFAGTHQVDLPVALRKLRERTGIRKLLLDCDWDLQKQFLEADLVDELSLVIDPAKGKKPVLPTGFARKFQLLEQRPLKDGSLLMRYGNRKINRGLPQKNVEHNSQSIS